jgi:hypothetical protein
MGMKDETDLEGNNKERKRGAGSREGTRQEWGEAGNE